MSGSFEIGGVEAVCWRSSVEMACFVESTLHRHVAIELSESWEFFSGCAHRR